MKTWNSKGHLTELALELHAAGEAAEPERQAIAGHLEACADCRARQAAWRGLFLALTSLQAVEPSGDFDARVLERVRRRPERARAPAARASSLLRRLRPVAAAAAAVWTAAVAGGLFWLQSQVEVSPPALLAGLIGGARELLVGVAIKLGTLLEITGLGAAWTRLAETVPGPGVASALALMTLVSGFAIWMLYRVTTHQPSKIDAHV